MPTVVLREVGIALAFFAPPFWAFGLHWEAFATGGLLVALDAYMAQEEGSGCAKPWACCCWIGSD